MVATCYKAGATFSGSVGGGPGGTTLTVSGGITGTIQIGQYLSAVSGLTTTNNGVANGTFIVSGSVNTWTLNQNPGTTNVVPLVTYAIIPTAFQTSFGSTGSTNTSTFYSSSTRLNTGDRLLLLATPSTSPALAGAQDLTCQLDLF
jgi:hypothetical protein